MFEARNVLNQIHAINPTKSVIRQIYLQLLQDQPRVPWKCFMYRNDARPKSRFTTWLQLQGRLLTTDRLLKWGIDVNSKCCLCQLYDESREHLFVQCQLSRNMWDRALNWMQSQPYNASTWEQHLNWAISRAKGKSQTAQIFKMLYTEITHALCIERNLRIFEKKSRPWETIMKEIIYVICVRAPPRIQNIVHSLIF
ncbi:uncharacterized protein LOC132601795 [Lycium barbarum]|uniref:uncharacterized protein LOC132601795 n=1 Tax=Lycium barbarum TaxID=112863 RepID=UPI00293EBA9A|nr:uncharacterized protein LOC132601795 [Lycium barbarum]